LQDNDASDCAKEKKEKEKIREMDADPTQKPGDNDFNRARSTMRTRILMTLLETMRSIKEMVLG
jgi:hypothetical protein